MTNKRVRLAGFFAAIVAEVALLAALHLFDDWTEQTMPVRFVVCAFAAGAAYLLAVALFPTDSMAGARQQMVLWGIAIVMRLVMLPVAPGDDLWRYQWEGKIQLPGFNPYVVAPDDEALAPMREAFPDWQKINHREWSAIYPPGAEIIFAALSRISSSPLIYKFVFAAADLATVGALLSLLGRGPSRWRTAAWYAWNPIVVYSFAGAAHFDSLMILATVAAAAFLVRQEEGIAGARNILVAVCAAVALGAAISIKLIPALLLLPAAFALGRRAALLAISVAMPVALSFIYGFPRVDVWHSLGQFAKVTRLNDLFWWLVEATVWANPRQKNLHYNITIVACALLVALIFRRDWKRGMLWSLGVALILSPVLHPWYCTWILPFAAWRGARPWHVLGVSLFAYYLFWNERLFALPWHSEPWLRALIILPPVIALLLAWRDRSSPPVSQAAT